MERRFGDAVLALAVGDITTIPADAIGNAANAGLVGGGGVDGTIHRAGGPAIMAELHSRHSQGTPTGTAVATTAGGLPAKWVIHAVGPVWSGGGRGEPELLASAYRSALSAAADVQARTVTLPAISTGVYGYPVARAAAVAVGTVADALRGGAPFDRVTFVLLDPRTFDIFAAALTAVR